jgi:hypothetical protein
MKQRLKAIFKGPVVFHPLLLAVFPTLFLYAYNIAETSPDQIWLPIVISVAATLVLWAILSLILRSLAKAGLAAAIFLAFFFSYGRFCDGLNYLDVFVPEHAYLLPSMLFIWGYCVYFINRTKRDFRVTTRWLNVVAVALIAINLFNVASYQVKLAGTSAGTPEESPTQAPVNPGETSNLPDIYFIILDEYGHPDTVKEWYDYDNSEFINSLEDKGFFIASRSKTRSPSTGQCLAQILNMEYLTPGWEWNAEIRNYVEYESNVRYSKAYIWTDVLFRKLGYSEVADFLKARGYEYIVFGSAGAWLGHMKDSTDLYINYRENTDTPWISAFQDALWQTTMLRPFYQRIVGREYEIANRRIILYTLEYLKMLPEREGPKFVYVHFRCPHEPFVLGQEGEYIAPENWTNHEDKQFYLGQYVFISTEIEELVGVLLEKSEVPPIIILQSDHGMRTHYPVGDDEWHKILNAMYLPGMDYSELSDSISPVNTFRLIFDHYFDADYPLLEDD